MEERGLCLWVKIIFMLKFFNLQSLGDKMIMSCDTSHFKRRKYSFAMLCHCSRYLKETTNTPTLNGGDRGGLQILLFSEVILFEHNVSTILSPINCRYISHRLLICLLALRLFMN